jgi:DNA repair protein RadC
MNPQTEFNSIKYWAEDDRPREKMLLKGRLALSDAELLAILINTGNKNETALDLAKKILQLSGNDLNALSRLTINELKKVKGIGEAKAITLAAALELGRRKKDQCVQQKPIVKCSKDSYQALAPLLSDLNTEEFWILLLDRSNRIIQKQQISRGGISQTIVDVRIILKYAIDCLASGIVLGHNHPSGSLKPSEPDINLTKNIREAAKLIHVSLIDHIIVGHNNNYFSFTDEGTI